MKHLRKFMLMCLAVLIGIVTLIIPRHSSSWWVSFVHHNHGPSTRPGLSHSDFTGPRVDHSKQALVSAAYGKLPLSFEANYGQAEPAVKFISRGSNHSLFLTATEAILSLRNPRSRRADNKFDTSDTAIRVRRSRASTMLRMKLIGTNPEPQVSAIEQLPGKLNYFIGNDPKKWLSDVSTYAKIKYSDVYPGIDLIYYGNQGQLEYDFVVAPGAEPSAISLEFKGAHGLRIIEDGDLVIRATAGEIRQHKPIVYQEVDGTRKEIASRYVMTGDNRIGFQLEKYDVSRPLVIDPVVLIYSTYLGGNGHDGIADNFVSACVDAAGNTYVTGLTTSTNFPTSPGAFQSALSNDAEVFITKLNPAGTAIVYSTYLGGNGFDVASSIAVDSTGNAYVTGGTNSADFPTTPGVFQTPQVSSLSIFLTKLNPTGTSLVYSTFFGGGIGLNGNPVGELSSDIAVDSSGCAYVVGFTIALNFPTTPGAFQTAANGGGEIFITKFNPAGTALVYSTYLGGTGEDHGNSVAVDSSGGAYVTGNTTSNDFPAMPGDLRASDNGVLVAKLNPTGTALVYSAIFGSNTGGRGIVLDTSGNAYVAGTTISLNFPTTPGAFQRVYGGGQEDSFVTKLNATGTALIYSTYLGGSGSDQSRGRGIAVDAAGNAYVTGNTDSINFPTANDPFQSTRNVDRDAFVTKLNPTGTALVYSTYLGASNSDYGVGIAVDTFGNAYVVGTTASPDFPTTPGAFQTIGQTNNGNNFDVFVAKISDPLTSAMGQVQALITGGTLTQNQGDGLITKLNDITAKLDNGQTGAACNELNAFTNQINAFANNGSLTSAQAQALITAANAVRVSVGC